MKIEMSRGKDRYIVQENGTFFLVDLMCNEATQAEPPNNPDIFLKSGGWDDAGKVDSKTLNEIKEALKNKRQIEKPRFID